MRHSSHQIFNAIVLAGLTLAGGASSAQNLKDQSSSGINSSPSPQGIWSPPVAPRTPESDITDRLGFERLLRATREKTAGILKEAANLAVAASLMKEIVKDVNAQANACPMAQDPEILRAPDIILSDFNDSVAREVRFRGETREGQAQRVQGMTDAIQRIKRDMAVAKETCDLKFSS